MKRCRSSGSKKRKVNPLFLDNNYEKWTNSYSRQSQYWDPKYGMLYQDKQNVANVDRIEKYPLTCCGNSPAIRSHSQYYKILRPAEMPLYSSFGLVDKENRKILIAGYDKEGSKKEYERP